MTHDLKICERCVYYNKQNNTCESKKAATAGAGYVTIWDRLFCKPRTKKE